MSILALHGKHAVTETTAVCILYERCASKAYEILIRRHATFHDAIDDQRHTGSKQL